MRKLFVICLAVALWAYADVLRHLLEEKVVILETGLKETSSSSYLITWILDLHEQALPEAEPLGLFGSMPLLGSFIACFKALHSLQILYPLMDMEVPVVITGAVWMLVLALGTFSVFLILGVLVCCRNSLLCNRARELTLRAQLRKQEIIRGRLFAKQVALFVKETKEKFKNRRQRPHKVLRNPPVHQVRGDLPEHQVRGDLPEHQVRGDLVLHEVLPGVAPLPPGYLQ
ncbi:hypothetical protein OTU49_009467 [Cherax quadricarinatus]|uniref:Uncharacterized protein n=1 Tax=Cherax quadricarinatus TaxID=27406 RepID=A0AAW0WKH4_CHEQU